MSSVLDQPASERRERREGRDSTITSAPAQQLRLTMAAVRVCFTWLGVRKTLSPEQKEQAAESFGAEGAFLSAGKKLLDTSHPAYKAVTAVRYRVVAYWKGISLPFPEAGIRLIRQSDLAAFDVQMTTHRQEDGRSKVFRDSAIDNFREFFDRLRTLNVRSNEELDRLVEQAQLVLRGVEPRELRTSQTLREDVAADLSPVRGPILGPFTTSSQALAAEKTWLETRWLNVTRRSATAES